MALQFCIDKLGIDRIMWAVDWPLVFLLARSKRLRRRIARLAC